MTDTTTEIPAEGLSLDEMFERVIAEEAAGEDASAGDDDVARAVKELGRQKAEGPDPVENEDDDADEELDGEALAEVLVVPLADGSEVEVTVDSLAKTYAEARRLVDEAPRMVEEAVTERVTTQVAEHQAAMVGALANAYTQTASEILGTLQAAGILYTDDQLFQMAAQPGGAEVAAGARQMRQMIFEALDGVKARAEQFAASAGQMTAEQLKRERATMFTRLAEQAEPGKRPDPRQLAEEAPVIEQYLQSRGFKAQEAASITDPRAWAIVRENVMLRQMLQRARETKPTPAPPPKAADRRAAPAAGRTTAMRRFEQTGNLDDLYAAVTKG